MAPMDTSTALRITLNGAAIQSSARTLEDLLAEQGLADAKVATAVNGTFVPVRARSAIKLSAGDAIEILSARQGG